MDFIEILKAILFGIVEGITEWLPISSTGHMILLDELVKLNVSNDFREMFLVVIQLGAILAVVVLYFKKLWPFSAKEKYFIKKDTFLMWFKILAACIPAAVVGILFLDGRKNGMEPVFYQVEVDKARAGNVDALNKRWAINALYNGACNGAWVGFCQAGELHGKVGRKVTVAFIFGRFDDEIRKLELWKLAVRHGLFASSDDAFSEGLLCLFNNIHRSPP